MQYITELEKSRIGDILDFLVEAEYDSWECLAADDLYIKDVVQNLYNWFSQIRMGKQLCEELCEKTTKLFVRCMEGTERDGTQDHLSVLICCALLYVKMEFDFDTVETGEIPMCMDMVEDILFYEQVVVTKHWEDIEPFSMDVEIIV